MVSQTTWDMWERNIHLGNTISIAHSTHRASRMITATMLSATKSGLRVLRRSMPRKIYATTDSSQNAQPADMGAQETLKFLQQRENSIQEAKSPSWTQNGNDQPSVDESDCQQAGGN